MTQAISSRPRLLVVAGPNGAGKTTITERGLEQTVTVAKQYASAELVADMVVPGASAT
jgi:predicted ABC-type ATPase